MNKKTLVERGVSPARLRAAYTSFKEDNDEEEEEKEEKLFGPSPHAFLDERRDDYAMGYTARRFDTMPFVFINTPMDCPEIRLILLKDNTVADVAIRRHDQRRVDELDISDYYERAYSFLEPGSAGVDGWVAISTGKGRERGKTRIYFTIDELMREKGRVNTCRIVLSGVNFNLEE